MMQILSFVKQGSSSFGKWFSSSSSRVYAVTCTYILSISVSQTSRWKQLLLYNGYALCMWCYEDSVCWRHVLMRDMNKLHANYCACSWKLIGPAFQRGSSLYLQLFNLLIILILVSFWAGDIYTVIFVSLSRHVKNVITMNLYYFKRVGAFQFFFSYKHAIKVYGLIESI